MLIPTRLRLITSIAVSALALLQGCRQTAGPTASQDRSGQAVTNSPLNKVTLSDDQGTTTAEVAGTTDWTKQDASGTLSHTTGMVTRTVVVERPDGTRLTVRSGSDIAASGVRFDPATGTFNIDNFTTSSSAPLLALSELQSRTVDAVRSITAEQAAVLKTVSENQKQTILGIAEKVSPEFLNAVRALFNP